jgi:aquaporin Z
MAEGDWTQQWRRLTAELLGTFALTFVAAGGPVIGAFSGGGVSRTAAVVAPALLIMAMIYTVGGLSGAHFNPAVTMAFVLRRDFPLRRAPAYVAAQVVGAVGAALVLRSLFGTVAHLGATLPSHGQWRSFVMELLLTFLLVTVILGTAAGHKIAGHNAAIAVGGYIALAGLFASPITGASMNPARSFGPALIDGDLHGYWVYLAGPVGGAASAVAVAFLLRGHRPDPSEIQAAAGNQSR